MRAGDDFQVLKYCYKEGKFGFAALCVLYSRFGMCGSGLTVLGLNIAAKKRDWFIASFAALCVPCLDLEGADLDY